MGQDGGIKSVGVVPVHIHVMSLRVIAIIMASVVDISYVEIITALIHLDHLMTAVMTLFQVQWYKMKLC